MGNGVLLLRGTHSPNHLNGLADFMPPAASTSSCMRYLIAVLVGLIIFGNHYVRDSPGALEKQIEDELRFTAHDYSILNALYFFPNIATPLLAGIFIKQLGGIPKAFLLSVMVVSVGHLVFGLGVELVSKPVMFIGKAITGSMYEIIDALMPIIYLSPIFKQEFPLVVGSLQIFLRSGSIVNFVLSPMIYAHYGLKAAFWVSTAIGCTAIPCFLAARYIEVGSLSMTEPVAIEAAADEEKGDASGHIPSESSGCCSMADSFPPAGFGALFYLYMVTGAFLYGGIVPFWFFGSKYLQDSLLITVASADRILAIPELMVVVVGIPMGFALSYCHWSMRTKLSLMTAVMGLMTASYVCLLAVGYHVPEAAQLTEQNQMQFVYLAILSVLLMGFGFSVACNVFWSLISYMVAEQYLSPATGLISCAVNLLPSLLPPVIAQLTVYFQHHAVLIVLIVMTALGTGTSLVATLLVCCHPPEQLPAAKQEAGASGTGTGSREYEMVPVLEPVELDDQQQGK